MTTVSNGQYVGDINIDLVPYEVYKEGAWLVVKDCAGSALGNLETPERKWWNENCGDYIGGVFTSINYDADAEQCEFNTHDFDAVCDWVSENLDSMLEIGYETLRDLPNE